MAPRRGGGVALRRGNKAWRAGACCSHAAQSWLTHLLAARADLLAMADPRVRDALFARCVGGAARRALRAYWRLAPSEARAPTFIRDVRVMCAIVSSQSGGEAAKAADDDADDADDAAAAAAAGWCVASAGSAFGSSVSIASTARRSAPRRFRPRGRPADRPAVGGTTLASTTRPSRTRGSPRTTAAAAPPPRLAALALPGEVTAAFKPPPFRVRRKQKEIPPLAAAHAGAQGASHAAMPEVDWSQLLRWEAFPLRRSAALVHRALRRLPALQPEAIAVAAEEVAAGHLDESVAQVGARKELALLLGVPGVSGA